MVNFLSTYSFVIIWMGKTLANCSGFAKSAKAFPCYHFALYGTQLHTDKKEGIILDINDDRIPPHLTVR